MSSRLFLLLSLVFSFLQGQFLPAVFFEGILLIFLLLARPSLKIAPTVAVSGLLFDLVQNGRLGFTSIIFLAFLFLFYLVYEHIQIQKAGILSILVIIINALRWQFSFGVIDIWSCFGSGIVAFILLHLFWQPVDRGRIRI